MKETLRHYEAAFRQKDVLEFLGRIGRSTTAEELGRHESLLNTLRNRGDVRGDEARRITQAIEAARQRIGAEANSGDLEEAMRIATRHQRKTTDADVERRPTRGVRAATAPALRPVTTHSPRERG